MNVLSLFDGISCGQIALSKANIPIDKYYASEIDTDAIKITQKNYPNTIQIGDATKIDFSAFKNKIDILLGGFPCQDLSINKYQREGLKGRRSSLFYTFVKALKEIQPKYFFVENVASMSEENKNEITEILGVEPVMFNSSLVSAQRRKRLYWTNIPCPVIEDKGIHLKDILEDNADEKYHIKSEFIPCEIKGNSTTTMRIGNMRNHAGKISKCQYARVYSINGKSVTLCSEGGGWGSKTGLYKVGDIVRKLTPIEAERCQSIPDNYTEGFGDGIRYRVIGNAWTVDIIAEFMKKIKS